MVEKVDLTQLSVSERQKLLRMARALSLKSKTDELPPITKVVRGNNLALSFAQQRMWFLAQMEQVSAVYHIPITLRVLGGLQRAELGRALDRIVQRHETLRTTFAMVNGEAVQRISPAEESRFHLIDHDLRHHQNAPAELQLLVDRESQERFDLEVGPLIRGRLIRLADDEHALLITMHHIISDGWSIGVFYKELSLLYGAYVCSERHSLPTLELQYADYAAWQRTWLDGEIQQQAVYWKNSLDGAPELLEVPADRTRPRRQDYSGAMIKVNWEEELVTALKALGRRHGATLYLTLLAAWAVLLGRLSGQDDVVIGTPVANRDRVEIENLIGFFVNTLVVRVDVGNAPTLGEVLERVKKQALAAQQHQDMPFELVVEIVQPVRSLGHSPLFQVMFAWQNTAPGRLELKGLTVERLPAAPHMISKFDLTLSVGERDGRIVGGLEYATALFEASTVERYLNYLRRLLEAMVADDAQPANGVGLLSVDEREQILYEWNETAAEYPREGCIHDLFEEQARERSEAVAVVHQCSSLTYGELNARANLLAHSLRGLGVSAGDRVAICLNRGIEVIIAELGVLKAGGACVPLNPADPEEHKALLLSDSGSRVAVTSGEIIGLEIPGIIRIDLDKPPLNEEGGRREDLNFKQTSERLAFILYTPEEMGQPNGVLVTHRNVVALARNTDFVNLKTGQTIGQVSDMESHPSTFEVWGGLLNGGRVAVIERKNVSRVDLERQLKELSVSMLFLTSALLREYSDNASGIFQGMERIFFEECCDEELIKRVLEQKTGELVQVFGVKETMLASAYTLEEKTEGKKIPIGRPISNSRMYVMDDEMEPVGVGVAGEICIGGSGVAWGYMNRADLTAERFVPEPYAKYAAEGGMRLYRTGALGRWNRDGCVELLGQKKLQLKVRGFRVELSEIESRLVEYKGLHEAVVVAREGVNGAKQLVAYYTVAPENGTGGIAENNAKKIRAKGLHGYLAQKLPEYMVPAAYVHMAKMPRMANGQLDRNALPMPDEEAFFVSAYEPPEGRTENGVAGIWREVLHVERVGRWDNFFELGGRSLLAVQVIARLRDELGVEVGVDELFGSPVLSDFAQAVETAKQSSLPAISRTERGERVPLSFAQQRLWFLAQIEGGSDAYHIPLGMRLRGKLDRLALKEALDRLVARHEPLRTTFALVDGEPVQRIAAAEKSRFHLEEDDLRDEAHVQKELDRLIIAEAGAAFDLETGPLIRGRLIQAGEEDHALLITLHHIVADGWSVGVLFKELSLLYGALLQEEPDPLPELAVQYADYAVWQRKWMEGAALAQQAEYWRKNLEGAPELELPADHERPAQQDYAGALLPVMLNGKLTAELKALTQRHGTTLYMTLLAGWAALLGRLSGQQDVVIGTPVANRGSIEIENLIGHFLNMLVVRVDTSDKPTVSELLARVKSQAIAAQQHQDIPFEQVVDIVQPVRSLAHSPIFQVMFAWQDTSQDSLGLPGLEVTPLTSLPRIRSKFDMSLSLQESGELITGAVEYATALFERETVERYAGYYQRFLGGMATDDSQIVDSIELLSAVERHQILSQWNDTQEEYPQEKCAHQLFEEQVGRTPEAVALVYQGSSLTYGELNRRANQLAHYLRTSGIKPGALVGICMERGLEMIVGLLGVLKTGAAYLPLDPSYPVERLKYMLEDATPAAVLTMESLCLRLPETMNFLLLDSDDLKTELSGMPVENSVSNELGSYAAYVIYTSGSTGKPKGVVIENRALSCFLHSVSKRLPFEPGAKLVAVTTISFDISILELVLPLCHGAQVQLASQEELRDGIKLGRLIRSSQAGSMQATPSHWSVIVREDRDCLRDLRVISGGEALSREMAALLQQSAAGSIYNLYGPTEATVWASLREVEKGDIREGSPAIVTIGGPLPNYRMYVLDACLEPTPAGVTGDLYIVGTALGRGYLHEPALTAEKFICDSFGGFGERMYRTGDRARWVSGRLEFLGRADQQVKIRGFRIELGEIEALLSQHSGIGAAVVIMRQDAAEDKRLVAYYTPAGKDSEAGSELVAPREEVGADALRDYLAGKLPEYMLPSAYVRLAELPLTANGKLNRKALPAPTENAYGARQYQTPKDGLETAVAEIWAEALKVERVGRYDNFFRLGGHSLLVVRMISRLRKTLGVEVGISDVFVRPVLSDFVRGVEAARQSRLPALTRAEREGKIPPSFAQQRLWFLAQMNKGSEAYHLQFGVRLRGRLEVPVLKKALDRIVARHEALRTTFVVEEGELQQRIAEGGFFHLFQDDLRQKENVQDELERMLAKEASGGFDLAAGPLIRGRLLRMAENEHALVITVHHVIADWWSMGVLFKELSTLYGVFMHGEEDPLPELALQYADYTVWQRKWMEGEVLEQQAEYWRKNLEGAPELLELPADRMRPAQQDYIGGIVPVRLNSTLTSRLKELSTKHGTTLYMTLLASWVVLLGRLSGQQDVVIGTPVANRGSIELENLIGLFVNMLVIRMDMAGKSTVSEVLARAKRQVIAAQENQDIPFEQVVEIVQPVRSLAHTPLFQVTFTWLDQLESAPSLTGLEIEPLQLSPHVVSKFDMALLLQESQGSIKGVVEYAAALFDPKTVERYLGYFIRLLEGIVAAGDNQAIDGVTLLTAEQQQQVIYGWNNTARPLPGTRCVHQLFEQQVRRTPEAVAVACKDRALSYLELNTQANRLAHHLRSYGVGIETRVGACLERSVEMIVVMLGILKAGAAYVPLDAEYPAERLERMMEDAGVGMVVTDRRLREHLPSQAVHFVQVVCIDEEENPINSESAEDTGLELDGDDLAYVMYTSGSTGRPKGVMVTHQNITRLVWNTNYVEFRPALVIAHASNVVFDASTFEIWGALLNGCRVVVIPKPDLLTPEVFTRQLKDMGVSTLFLTTALFQECVRTVPGIFSGMDQILFGGEACDAECVRQAVEKGPREVVHVYGPTETTTFASYLALEKVEEKKPVPIGRPIANATIYIVDKEMEAVGLRVPGEIYIGGLGLGRGYGNDPALTAERFIPNPFSSENAERLYRTGDLGRWRDDGTIEFLGRVDAQVKIRGYRIELGEVEAALREQPDVKEALAVAWEKGNGDKQLVAYVAGKKDTSLTVQELHQALRKRLPEYMVPMVMVLQEFPLTATGKLDRRRLPRPEEVLDERRIEYVPPRNSTEAILAEIWADVLAVKRVGMDENFFELGGDSILCVRIIGRAREQGLKLSVQDLFQHQTIGDLAAVARREREEYVATAPFELLEKDVRATLPPDVEDAYPLGRLQAGMLFHSGYSPESGVYHDVISYRLHLPYEAERFQSAVDRLAERHEILRTSIDTASYSEPLQLVHKRVRLGVVEEDWRSLGWDEQKKALAAFVERERKTGFIWEQAPPMRIFVHRLSDDIFQCSLSFHHAFLDGWSEASLITELVKDYECCLAGRLLEFKAMQVRYRDYIALERRAMASEESRNFWMDLLKGHTVTPVPLREWHAEEKSNSGVMLGRTIYVSESTHKQLQHLAREVGTPLKTVLLAAHMKALQVLSGQSDVTTGVALNGRPEVEGAQQVLGLFLNTVPFRLQTDCRSWRSLIRETFEVEQRILPHRRYPMVDLRKQMGHESLFETTFNYVHFHVYNELGDEGGKVIEARGGYALTNLDLFVNFEVTPETGDLRGTVHCDTGTMSAAALERIAGYYERILAGMIEDRISDFRSEEERNQIEEWNGTETAIPLGCVHEHFEYQALKLPDSVAIVSQEGMMSYAALNAKANALAQCFRESGINPGERIAICLNRGVGFVMAGLAVWKAAGVYLPLEPEYPAEHKEALLFDNGVRLVVSSIGIEIPDLPGMKRVDVEDWMLREGERENPGLKQDSEGLACILYSSGPAEQSKGVMITHEAIMPLVVNNGYAKFKESDRVAFTSNPASTASMMEIWGPLLNGGSIVLIEPDALLDPKDFGAALKQHGVTVLWLAVRLFNRYAEVLQNEFSRMRCLIIGADSPDTRVTRSVMEAGPPEHFIHAYGLTETAGIAVTHEVHGLPIQGQSIPIGRPATNKRVYIVDADFNPVSLGVVGEICIGGPAMARGYVNAVEHTAASFVPVPHDPRAHIKDGEREGERMYRTGDLGRWREDGRIEFIGRKALQVTVRGFRIALWEIEAQLRQHEGVKDVVVVVQEDGSGEQRLLAYYTAEGRTRGSVGAGELRGHLMGRLPEYMVPTAYVLLEKLPVMTNGKLDRSALPAPEGKDFAVRRYEAPEGEIETALAEMWMDVLQVEQVGRHDNFFELGGRSLLAVQLIGRLRQTTGVEIGIKELFAHPVLTALAELIVNRQLEAFDPADLANVLNEIDET